MDLLKGELSSSGEVCETSTLGRNDVNDIEAGKVSYVTEEEDQEPTTIPVIKTEPDVSYVFVVSVTRISYRLYPELLAIYQCVCILVSVCPYQKEFYSRKWILSIF
jgi:hypothetical protein